MLRKKCQQAEIDRMKALAKEQEQALLNAREKLAAERSRAEEEAARLRDEQEKLAALAVEQARTEQAEREVARLRAELTATLSQLTQVREDARGVVVTLPGNILFNVNKADVKPAMRMQLTKIAKALATVPDQHLVIEGHTDSDGSADYNLTLSELRARSVQKILVDGGIPDKWMEVKGCGESKPIAYNDTPDGKANNRRVEIVVVSAKE